MRFICGTLVFSLVSLAGHCVTLAAPPEQVSQDKSRAEVGALIEQLGDAAFSRREKATENLIRLGLPAMKTIEELGVQSSDREIRYRSKIILNVLHRLDFQRRLKAFSENQNSQEDYDLPGWKRYQELVGRGKEARALFVEMLKTESEALRELEKSPQKAGQLLDIRTKELQFAMNNLKQQPSLGSIAALLFLAGDPEVPVNQQSYSSIYNFCYQQSFRTAITSGPQKELAEKLLGAWIRRGEGWPAYQGMMLAMQYNLKDGLVPAEKILKQGGQQPHIRLYAILTFAKFGNDSHIPLLEKILDDESTITNARVDKKNVPIQTRDVALAALLHIAKQDLKKYGFKRVVRNTQYVFTHNTLLLDTPEIRLKALKDWKNYRRKEKK